MLNYRKGFLPSLLRQLPVQLPLFGGKPKTPLKPKCSDASSLVRIWTALWRQHFPDRPDLAEYTLRWSDRAQRNCLASCNTRARTVNVAGALREPEAQLILEPLLYHEMCHAVLGAPRRNGRRRVFHGPEFRALEKLHPEIPELDKWISEGNWVRLARRARRRRR